MQEENELLDVQEVANRLRVNPRTVLRMAERGELDAIKVARRWRFRRSILDEYLHGQSTGSGSIVATREQIRHSGVQKVEPRKQPTQLDGEQQQIDIVKQRLEVVNHALETAEKLVNTLLPDADEKTRASHLKTMLPRLLEPGTSRDLLSVLPDT